MVHGTVSAVRARGQDGRRRRDERVRARRPRAHPQRRAVWLRNTAGRARAGPAQQVVRDTGRVRRGRVPAVPVRLAVRSASRGRPTPIARRPTRRTVLLDRRRVCDRHAGPSSPHSVGRPAAGLRDRPRPGTLLCSRPATVRLPGRARRRRSRPAPPVPRTTGPVPGRERVVRRVPQVEIPSSVSRLVEEEPRRRLSAHRQTDRRTRTELMMTADRRHLFL